MKAVEQIKIAWSCDPKHQNKYNELGLRAQARDSNLVGCYRAYRNYKKTVKLYVVDGGFSFAMLKSDSFLILFLQSQLKSQQPKFQFYVDQ